MMSTSTSSISSPLSIQCFDHTEEILQRVTSSGAKIVEKSYWIYFFINAHLPRIPLGKTYSESARQWKILLNPTRDHFYETVERAIRAIQRTGIFIQGKVIAKDILRRSESKVLDDPCEPKLLFYVAGNTIEEGKIRCIAVIKELISEWKPEEQTVVACESGSRYVETLGRATPQRGPSFTDMVSPLIFYQQGGYIESGRELIVNEEITRMVEGLQDRQTAHKRVLERLSHFFSGKNFFLYKDGEPLFPSFSPPFTIRPDPEHIHGMSEQIEPIFEALPLVETLQGSSERFAMSLTAFAAAKAFFRQLDVDSSPLAKQDRELIRTQRFRTFYKVRAICDWWKSTFGFSQFYREISRLGKTHPALKEVWFLSEERKLEQKKIELPRTTTMELTSGLIEVFIKHRELFPEKDPRVQKEKSLQLLSQVFTVSLSLEGVRYRNVQWITGSSTSSLIPMFRSLIGDHPALVPTGSLVDRNIPPLSGELKIGIRAYGVNRKYLSGVHLNDRKIALKYASGCAKTISVEYELALLNSLSSETRTEIFRAKIAALRLASLEVNQQRIVPTIESLQYLATHLDRPHSITGWEPFLPLVGNEVPPALLPVPPSFSPGMIVAVIQEQKAVIGLVISTTEGTVVLIDREGSEYKPSLSQLRQVSSTVLQSCSAGLQDGVFSELFLQKIVALGSEAEKNIEFLESYVCCVGQTIDPKVLEKPKKISPGMMVGIAIEEGRGPRFFLVVRAEEGRFYCMGRGGEVLSFFDTVAPSLYTFEYSALVAYAIKQVPLIEIDRLAVIAKRYMRSYQEEVFELIDILSHPKPWPLTTEEKQFLETPTPIIWGTVTETPSHLEGLLREEQVLFGPQELGRNIQLLFAEEEVLPTIQSYIQRHLPPHLRIHILSLELLRL